MNILKMESLLFCGFGLFKSVLDLEIKKRPSHNSEGLFFGIEMCIFILLFCFPFAMYQMSCLHIRLHISIYQ